jgi:aminoglycoside 3-N-acetyltransferase
MPASQERDALVPILQRAGVPRDGVLVVHSAIARLSRQGFRAEAMIETLLDYMSAGTLIMPTMTWRTVTPERPVWNEIGTRSETGIMTEIFRTRYASRRSIHPTHSVAAHGAAADIMVARHHLDDTPVSANSPYGLMRDYDAAIMMLGVGLESCTAIHLPEETIAADVYLRPRETAKAYACTDRGGTLHSVPARRHRRLDRDFARFGPPLAAQGLLHSGDIEGCPYIVVALHDLLREITAALIRSEYATLRDGRPPEQPAVEAAHTTRI